MSFGARPRARILPLLPRMVLLAPALGLAIAAALPRAAIAQEDHSGLTRASYRRNCMLCHSATTPEGISSEIIAGLRPFSGTRPRDAMPGIVCQRRCETCRIVDPPATR